MYLRHDLSVRRFCMEDRAPSRLSYRAVSPTTTPTAINIMKAAVHGFSPPTEYPGWRLFGVLAYFFSDFIAH